MPHIAPPLPESPEMTPNRVRWTTSQCRALVGIGVLTEHYELIDGDILLKAGQTPPHAYTVRILIAWLNRVFGDLHVQCQLPVSVGEADADHNEPEPDAAVMRGPNTDFAARHPGPADLSLVVEVSDTTLRIDRAAKSLLYARAGIVEYWLLDVAGRQLLIHRDPGLNGYGDVAVYGEDEEATTLARPDVLVRVADLLPPAAI